MGSVNKNVIDAFSTENLNYVIKQNLQ